MDESGLNRSSKKHKLNEEQGIVDGNTKCLENLPEEILRYIISLLPTNDAVRTSILCKRWEYLWTSIPNLGFKKGSKAKRKLFMNFVERVLLLHDSSDIKQFTLYCDVLHDGDASRIKAWISSAIRHNVQELVFDLNISEEQFSLPRCLFTCVTLTKLQFDMPCVLKIPPTIYFTNLKILTVGNVTFSDDYTTQKLFSGLPVLEEMFLEYCIWVNLTAVSISSPKLHRLRIIDDEQNSDDEDGCQVMIFGPGLKTFTYCGPICNDYCLYNSCSLERVVINACDPGKTARQVAYRMYRLLSGLSTIKKLKLSSGAVEVLNSAAELLPHVPMFNNVTHLEFDDGPTYLDRVALSTILEKFPRLNTLEFPEGINLSVNCKNADGIPAPVPPCFLSHLRCIKVYCYAEVQNQLPAIKNLLKNAVALDKIVISSNNHFARDFEKQLMEFPRGSKNCKFIIY
ncbi:F-box/LRR-repeat protein At4g14103-like [Quercus lobata]|uniref:F-box domain-containing protein n=1 Tax=Quercus lobata TaxID=97700 RepID=A0A7N2QXX7_QUELO|nr:F-box/LRR-repeat protein At4g14103-like [Quercus lobata]